MYMCCMCVCVCVCVCVYFECEVGLLLVWELFSLSFPTRVCGDCMCVYMHVHVNRMYCTCSTHCVKCNFCASTYGTNNPFNFCITEIVCYVIRVTLLLILTYFCRDSNLLASTLTNDITSFNIYIYYSCTCTSGHSSEASKGFRVIGP